MKNISLILAMTFFFATVYGQRKGKEELITYTTEDKTNYTVGDSIHFGIGSNPNGLFRYVYKLKNAWSNFAYYDATLNYKFAIIDQIQKNGSDKTGYTVYFVFRYPAGKSAIMVESAISEGEVITPASKKKAEEKNKPIIIQQGGTSLADEIMKLKELLDQGILTQEEYDAQKQKLLNK